MKLRLVIIGGAAFAFALASHAIGGKAGPQPAPVGLQYEEIARVAFGSNTPPPPGSFQADRLVAMNAASAQAPAQPHGLGALLGSIASGNIGSAVSGAMGAYGQFMNGDIQRLSFYKGWVRTDDLAQATATISKCDKHQLIELDLTKKTYRVVEGTGSAGISQPSQSAGGSPSQAAAPGTVDLTLSSQATALGSKTLDGINTIGHRETVSMTMSNATGSCHNGQFASTEEEYVSGIHQPHAFCKLPVRVPMHVTEAASRGGCRPHFSAHTSGRSMASGGLVMYSLVSMGGAQSSGRGNFAFVTERGNVRSLYPADIPGLFEVPADFRKEQ